MILKITRITTSLGPSVANRFDALVLPVEASGANGLYRQELIVDYTWTGNSGAHHAKFGLYRSSRGWNYGNQPCGYWACPEAQGEPSGYVIDTQNSVSGVENGSATFTFPTYYPLDETFRDLNFVNDDGVNYIQGKGVVVTGSVPEEHYETGNTYVSESYIARPKLGDAVAGQMLSIVGYGNIHAEYLKVFLGGKGVDGFVNAAGHILTKVPSFEQVDSIAIELENGVSRVTGEYLDLASPPTITDVSPSNASWGDTVTISGTNFINITGLFLDSLQVSEFTVNSKTETTFVVPEETKGGYDIVICSSGGCSE